MNQISFIEALQQKTGMVFTATEICVDVYWIKSAGQDLNVFYYQGGAAREVPPQTSALQVVHIDEDQWTTSPALLLNRLASLYGKAHRIHARQTVVARIDKGMAMAFQEEHHLQGSLAGKYRYGLFEKGELLAVAVFSGLRNMRHTEGYRSIELLHFCQKGQYLVMGGLSKLLGAMVREFHPNDIMTYIDRDWSEGEKFESLGFQIKAHLAPISFLVEKSSFQRVRMQKNTEVPLSENYYIVQNLGSVKLIKLINP